MRAVVSSLHLRAAALPTTRQLALLRGFAGLAQRPLDEAVQQQQERPQRTGGAGGGARRPRGSLQGTEARDVTGKVKWFNPVKGFGFVTREDDQSDVFIHVNEIQMDGFKDLKTAQRVQFDIAPAERGPVAKRLRLIE